MTDPAAAALLTMLLQANRLKTTPRTGWAMRGVPRPESVADHSHGTALVALVLGVGAGRLWQRRSLDRAAVTAEEMLRITKYSE